MKKYGFKIYDDAKSLATFQELVAWNINVESWFLLTDLCSFLFSFSFGDQNQFLSQNHAWINFQNQPVWSKRLKDSCSMEPVIGWFQPHT